MLRSILALFLVGLALPSTGLAQQDTTGLVPGRRVRIHKTGDGMVAGTFLSADSSTMRILKHAGDTVVLPRSSVAGVDLSVGTKSKTWSGALVGAGAGAAGGAILGALGCDDESDFVMSTGGCIGYLAGAFAVLGAGVGALVGSGKRTDKWEPTAWPTVSFQPNGPEGGRVALGVHLRL